MKNTLMGQGMYREQESSHLEWTDHTEHFYSVSPLPISPLYFFWPSTGLILEAGRVAPTGANRQPQRLVVVQSKEGMERLARCTRDFGAPTAVIVCADTSEAWTRKYDGKNISDIDASIVTDHMMLAAASLSLDTLWICMFKPEAVREEFVLPANVEPVNILLIGYGDGPAADPNRHDTLRKPLSATVFHERF